MWKTVKLGDLFKIGSSKRVLKAEWKDSGIPFYRGREITTLSKTGAVDNDLFISEEHFSKLKANHGVPQSGDLLVTAIGTIGNTYIVREQDRFYFKDASVLWLHKISDVDSRFVNYWFKSSLFYTQLEVGNGATVDTLSISKLKAMNFLLPPLAEQERIVAKLDAAFAEIDEAVSLAQYKMADIQSLNNALLARNLFDTKTTAKLGDVIEIARGGSPRPIKSFITTEDDGVNWIKIGDTEQGGSGRILKSAILSPKNSNHNKVRQHERS
jgi:type I restriction enzyme S subunit